MYPLRLLLALTLALPLVAQVPNTLKVAIPSPPVGAQAEARLGRSVAVEGGIVVAGAPEDDYARGAAGVVKVFDSASGALLHTILKPNAASTDFFGESVAISGTRIAVGAYRDDTGAGDAGSAHVYDLASATPTVAVASFFNPSPASVDYFGHSVGISGTRVVVGVPRDDTGGSDAGTAYVYDLAGATPTVPLVTLVQPSPANFDSFGFSVAISGSRVVVGAYGDDTGASGAGSVYIYDLNSATPSLPVRTLHNPAPGVDERFGTAVAISGSRVLVGTSHDDTGATDAGMAYVYDLDGATPGVPSVILNNPDPGTMDYFGYAVAISGTRAVVGAFQDDTGAVDTGSAYVYDLSSGTPGVPLATLPNPSPADADFFGLSVAISGTLAVVGASQDDLGALDAGSAYVYDVSGATPGVPTVTLNHPGPPPHDSFGISVATSGLWLAVGASGEDTGAADTGSVYLYDLGGAMPAAAVDILHNTSPEEGDAFGVRVAIAGQWVVVGASSDNTGASDAGSAYVYDLKSAMRSVPVTVLNNPSPGAGDIFGGAVAASGTRVVVGASSNDTPVTSAGSAYVYDLSSATPAVPVYTLDNPSPASGDSFGGAVAISGMRVVVGASGDDTDGSNVGIAYVYDLGGVTPTVPVATLHKPSPAAGDQFGFSIGLSGSWLVIGAPSDDTGASNAGSAYVYDLDSGSPPVPAVTLHHPSPGVSSQFGISVAIAWPRVAIGAIGDDVGADNAGRVFIYDVNGEGPTDPAATLVNPAPAIDDQFGQAVALSGSTVVVGTPRDDSPQENKGSAYVYRPADDDGDDDGLLDLWEEARFGTTAGHDADDDADGDGRVELLEQAFNLNPLAPDAANVPAVVNEGGYLTLTLAKRAGVSYLGQSAATPDGSAFSALTTTVITNTATTLKVRDNFPINGGAQRFLRVQVTAAP